MNGFDVNQIWKYFVDVVTNHYADFGGRVSRQDYWLFILTYVVIGIGVSIVAGLVGLIGILRPLYGLAMLLPVLGMGARRIQDTGKSGTIIWIVGAPFAIIMLGTLSVALALGFIGFLLTGLIFLPLSLLALIGSIYIIYLCIQPGTPAENAYGPVPPVATATSLPA